MKLINLQLLTALCLGLPAGAQTLDMDIKLAGTLNPEETRIFIHPVNDVSDQSTIERKAIHHPYQRVNLTAFKALIIVGLIYRFV